MAGMFERGPIRRVLTNEEIVIAEIHLVVVGVVVEEGESRLRLDTERGGVDGGRAVRRQVAVGHRDADGL